MLLSICIPVYNNFNLTKACLRDLSFLPDDHEVIVVNDGSDASMVPNLMNLSKDQLPVNILFQHHMFNEGFSNSCNDSFEKSFGEYVLFLNNDIRVQKNHTNWTLPLIEAAKDGSLVGPNGGLLDDNLNFIRETNKIEDGNFYMSGWCLCAKKETFNKLIINNYIGPFSEEFGKAYFEDTDLGLRAKRLNINMKIVPVPVIHLGKQTTNKVGLSSLYLPAKEKFIKKWQNKI